MENYEALKQCFESILNVLNNEIKNEADKDVGEAIGIIIFIIIYLQLNSLFLFFRNTHSNYKMKIC